MSVPRPERRDPRLGQPGGAGRCPIVPWSAETPRPPDNDIVADWAPQR